MAKQRAHTWKIQWNGMPLPLAALASIRFQCNSMLLFFGMCINNTIWSEFQTAERTSTNRNFEIGPCLYIWTVMRVCVYPIRLCPVWIWGAFVDLFSFVSICFQWEWLASCFLSCAGFTRPAEKDRHLHQAWPLSNAFCNNGPNNDGSMVFITGTFKHTHPPTRAHTLVH